MGDKTKIDWCDATWNPVTGCLHGCEYCYARKTANRFGGWCYSYTNHEDIGRREEDWTDSDGELHVLDEAPRDAYWGSIAPYPFYFDPTFHRYRLDIPARWQRPRNIFVCSMADLFGDWVPDEWIAEVFKACEAASQHRYLFLTKNPNRYIALADKGLLPHGSNFWYGYSATSDSMLWRFHHADECPCLNLFVSIEPMLEAMDPCFSSHTPADWVIVGAETGMRKDKVVTKREWVERILAECQYSGRPIFMKSSLQELMGDDFVQEYPWTATRG